MGIIFLPILFIVIYYPLGILVSLLTRKIHRVFKLFDILLSPVAMIGDLIHFLVRKRHPGFDFLDGKRFDIFFFTMVVLIAKDNVETNVITT